MKGLAKVFIRIFSIFLMVKGLQTIAPVLLVSFFQDTSQKTAVFYSIPSLFIAIAFSLLLWFFADILASKIAGEDNGNHSVSIDYENIELAAFAIVGLVLLVDSISIFLQNIFAMLSTLRMAQFTYSPAILNNTSKLIESLVKAIFGIWLLIGSEGILRMINRARSIGLSGEEAKEDFVIENKPHHDTKK